MRFRNYRACKADSPFDVEGGVLGIKRGLLSQSNVPTDKYMGTLIRRDADGHWGSLHYDKEIYL